MRLIAVISIICLIGILKAQTETCDKLLECKNAQRQHQLACDEFDKDEDAEKNRRETDRSLCKAEVKKIKETLRDLESQRFEMEVSCIVYNKNNSAIAASREAKKCQRLPYFVPPNINAFVRDERDGKRQVMKKRFACKKSLQAMKKTCKKIAKCCPSDELCNLEYELSGTHDKMAEVNKDAFMKNIECLAIPKRDDRKKFAKWNRKGNKNSRKEMRKRRNGLGNRFGVEDRGMGKGLQQLGLNRRGNRKGKRGRGLKKDWMRNGMGKGMKGHVRDKNWKREKSGDDEDRKFKERRRRGWKSEGRAIAQYNQRRHNRNRGVEKNTEMETVDEGRNVDDLAGMVMIDDVDDHDHDDDDHDDHDHDHDNEDDHDDHDHDDDDDDDDDDDETADREEKAFVASNLVADTDEMNDFGLNDF